MTDPRISVVVPNYNHARFLPRSLKALLDQSVPPLEIIVVDDASTDNSLEVLRSFAEKYPTVKVHVNERNLQVCKTMNRGMELARGDYIFFTAADDEVRPGLFHWATEMLRKHPDAGLCGGICEWRDEATGLTWYVGGQMPSQPCFLSPAEIIALSKRGRFSVAAQSAVFKKSALLEAGGWIPEFRWFTDVFGTYVVAFRHGMCHVPEVLANFNIAPNTYYHSARSTAERRQVMEEFLARLETEKYADVTPRIRESGILGGFGWQMARVVAGRWRHRSFLTVAFVRRVLRRSAEVIGRRLFPNWLARWCLRVFYGRK